MASIRRFLCFLWHGHNYTHHYTRDYRGHEVLVLTCTRCRRTVRRDLGQ